MTSPSNTLLTLLRLALNPSAEAPDLSALTGAEWEVLSRLREEISEGLVVLKGLAVARKYPVPSHRSCVDLDVYQI